MTHLHPSWPRPPRGSMRAWRTLEHTERERGGEREGDREREGEREKKRDRERWKEGGRKRHHQIMKPFEEYHHTTHRALTH